LILSLALFFLTITAANVFFWPRVTRRKAEGGLAVLIPARNEEANLLDCLASVIQQQAAEILVYDDHSTDGTAAIVRSCGDPRVRLIAPEPLPAGWFGKSYACSQLAGAATSEWLLFLDADARLEPDACARMVAEAQSRRLTLLSCWPAFETGTFWEALLMPMLNWVVFSIFPGPLSLFRRDRSLALAHGACLMVRRDIYEKLGGHGAVRNEIFEDTRLAQLWRERGERSLGLDGQEIVRVRMYNGLPEIWRGFQKNFYRAFRHQYNFWIFLALHFTVFVLPFFVFDWRACCAVLLARALLLLRFRQALWSVALHPFAELFLIALGLTSWLNRASVAWKGRQYA
jgi:glycosyltransferase involved in cell wall biosynthesis